MNQPPVTLRPATQEDEKFLLHLYSVNRLEEMRMTGWDEARIETFLQAQYSTRKAQYEARYPHAQNWIILSDNEPVGRHLIQPDPRLWAFIELAVLPAFRRRGIGTFVFKQHLQQAVETGAAVLLYVGIDNPARRIYERLGFVVTGQDGVYCEMLYPSRD